ncbi:hypothetical protein niasHT_029183 [Heterodera trifolii]|uniref:non-specific serine/threonine protein kinase n=1 Tax=Heterodera trifolii TaxID=157864 RepID=A0ABD2JFW7_9BILA
MPLDIDMCGKELCNNNSRSSKNQNKRQKNVGKVISDECAQPEQRYLAGILREFGTHPSLYGTFLKIWIGHNGLQLMQHQHRTRHGSDRKYKCSDCAYSCDNARTLKNHRRICLKDRAAPAVNNDTPCARVGGPTTKATVQGLKEGEEYAKAGPSKASDPSRKSTAKAHQGPLGVKDVLKERTASGGGRRRVGSTASDRPAQAAAAAYAGDEEAPNEEEVADSEEEQQLLDMTTVEAAQSEDERRVRTASGGGRRRCDDSGAAADRSAAQAEAAACALKHRSSVDMRRESLAEILDLGTSGTPARIGASLFPGKREERWVDPLPEKLQFQQQKNKIAELKCKYSRANAKVRWYKGRKELFSDGLKYKILIDKQSITLIINNPDPDDSGKYKCEANGVPTNSFVTVEGPSIKYVFLTPLPNTMDIYRTKQGVLTCKLNSARAPLVWQRDDEKPIDVDDPRYQIEKDAAGCFTLTIRVVERIDQGMWTASVNKDVISKCQVSVVEEPRDFVETLKSQSANENENVTFECVVNDEDIDVEWFHGDAKIKMDGRHFKVEERVGCHRRLLITNLRIEDQRQYKCTTKNDKTMAQLIVDPLKKFECEAGKQKQIKVPFEVKGTRRGDPKPILLRNGKPVDLSKMKDLVEVIINGTVANIVFKNPQKSEAGKWSLKLENTGGVSTEAAFELVVKGKPKTPKGPVDTLDVTSASCAFLRGANEMSQQLFDEIAAEMALRLANDEHETESSDVDEDEYVVESDDDIPAVEPKEREERWVDPLPAKLQFQQQVNKIAELKCKYSRANAKVHWYKGRKELFSDGPKYEILIDKQSITLIINNPDPDDSGKYKCEANGVPTNSFVTVEDSTDQQPLSSTARRSESRRPKSARKEAAALTPLDAMHCSSHLTPPHPKNTDLGTFGTPAPDQPLSSTTRRREPRRPIDMAAVEVRCADEPLLAKAPFNVPGRPYPPDSLYTTDNSIMLHWAPPLRDGGTPITEYELEKREHGTKLWEKAATTKAALWEKEAFGNVPDTRFKVTGVKREQIYEFRVAAVNVAGRGEWSKNSVPIAATWSPCKPLITMGPLACDMTVLVGEQAKLLVPYAAKPRPKFDWSKNGVPMEVRADPRAEEKISDILIQLCYQKCELSDTGIYSILIVNDLGSDSVDLRLKVVDRPAPPEGSLKERTASSSGRRRVGSTAADRSAQAAAAACAADEEATDEAKLKKRADMSIRALKRRSVLQEPSTSLEKELAVLLELCGQQPEDVLSWHDFEGSLIADWKKIAEGAFGEVFTGLLDGACIVLKIMPFAVNAEQCSRLVNGDRLKTPKFMFNELFITNELSKLSEAGNDFVTPSFTQLRMSKVVKGRFPPELLDAWNAFKKAKPKLAENERPDTYADEGLHFVIIGLSHGGKDLENYTINNGRECYSIFHQIALSLAVAEDVLEFEHRDLHAGNILVEQCSYEKIRYVYRGEQIDVVSNGVRVSIIDFSISRLKKEGVRFVDLSHDNGLFEQKGVNDGGDYQYDVYRLMKAAVNEKWAKFWPETNVLWMGNQRPTGRRSRKPPSNSWSARCSQPGATKPICAGGQQRQQKQYDKRQRRGIRSNGSVSFICPNSAASSKVRCPNRTNEIVLLQHMKFFVFDEHCRHHKCQFFRPKLCQPSGIAIADRDCPLLTDFFFDLFRLVDNPSGG